MTAIECPYCHLKFKTISGVKNHIRLTHDQHTCPVCGRWFRKLSIHLGKCNDEAHKRVWAIIGESSKSKKVREVRAILLQEG